MNVSTRSELLAALARPASGVAAFAAVAGLALSGGGYDETVSGVLTVVVWLALLVAAIAAPGEARRLPVAVLLAAGSLLLVVFLVFVSMAYSPDPAAAFREATRLAGYAGVLVLVALRGRRDGTGMLAGAAAAITLVGVLAIGSRLLGLGVGDAELAAAYPGSAGRLSWPVGYWNGLGALMALGVPLLIWLGSNPSSAAAFRGATGALGRGVLKPAWTAALVPVLVAIYMTASRGAVVAALIGVVLLVCLARGRRRAVVAAGAAGFLGSIPALVAVQLGEGLLSGPFEEVGSAELSAAVFVVLASALAWVLAAPASELAERLRLPRRALPISLGVLAAVLVVTVVAIGPGRVADDFTATSSEGAASIGSGAGITISASGSGRSQFWEAAAEAIGTEPLRGIGAGGFASFWTQEGELPIVIRSVHSEPLELLTELGPLGLIAFLLFAGVTVAEGVRWLRREQPAGLGEGARATADARSVPAACLALLAAGSVGLLIDWSWDLPVVAVPMLLAAGILLTGRTEGLRPANAVAGDGTKPEDVQRVVVLPAPLVAAAAIALAVPAVWAGFVGGVSAAEMERADAAYERGRLADAVRAARTAARLQPWASGPWERIAVAERAADNDEAALRAAELALRARPESFELWGLAAELSAAAGVEGASEAYAKRGKELAPLVYSATFRGIRGSNAER